jgi:hypothetical protein
MAVTVRKAGVFKPTEQPYINVSGTWKPAKKVYLRNAGTWKEVWPRIPNPPQNVKMTFTTVGGNTVINASWSAPVAGGFPWDVYRIQIHFPNRTGRAQMTPPVDKLPGQLTFSDDNEGVGWQHAHGEKVQVEVWTVRKDSTYEISQESAHIASTGVSLPGGQTTPPVVPPLATPSIPTSFAADVDSCALTLTWVHPGGTSLDKFEIQTWLDGFGVTTYTVTKTLRKWTTFPWNPDTVMNHHHLNTRIRSIGQGGASAWVTITGWMPGQVILSDYGYKLSDYVALKSKLLCTVDNMDYGVSFYYQKYGATSVHYTDSAGQAGKIVYQIPASDTFARDNVTKYRMGFQARNYTNGWTSRPQWLPWCIKIPNPVFIKPVDCNTWWSQPIPGKWRTNPQAENWFYQGKSISGNSYGCLFYSDDVQQYFDVNRIGYGLTALSWDVYTKRTNTGGLVAAVALNAWTHARDNDIYDAAPGLVDGPQSGPALVRDQKVWLGLPASWFVKMISGAAKGIAYYVPPGQSDNQLRPEIGNVSNRYMILDKPTYGSTLDGQIPGTLRITHDA